MPPGLPPFKHPNDYAVVVGINDYRPGIPTLQGCVNDAALFHDWLLDAQGGGLDPANATLVTAPSAPAGSPYRGQIEDHILAFYDKRMADQKWRGRRLYLYFAGHGVTLKAPLDAETGVVMGDAVRLALRSLLSRTTATRVREAALFEEIVLFVDCCRQLTANVMADCDLPDNILDPASARIPYLYGMSAPWAGTASERMLPHPGDPALGARMQGVFTHTLLQGLRCAIDDHGQITAASLKAFVRSGVQQFLPPGDNLRPPIDFNEDLPLISFGPGVGTVLEVAGVTAAGVAIDSVLVHDGVGLDVIATQRASTPGATFSFQMMPARYFVVARDEAGVEIASKAVELFGSPLHVDL